MNLVFQVAVSSTHTLVVSCDGDVFSWGEGRKGELGHGDLRARTVPERVEALKGKSIKRYNIHHKVTGS